MLWRRLLQDEGGATIVEFTVIVVLFLMTTFGIVKLGLALYWWTSAEKATQLGARLAVVSTPLVGTDADCPPAAGSLPAINCKTAEGIFGQPCRLSPSPCTGFATVASAASDRIFQSMQARFPWLTPANVVIRYEYVQLGFAGGPPVPAVTVELQDVFFPFIAIDALVNFVSGGGFPDGIAMPPMRAVLTGEDLNTAAPA